MEFNKPPEWGSSFHFPENLETNFDNLQIRVTEKIAAQMVDHYETAIVEEIASAARDAGVTDCVVLNKKAILCAIKKQIPQKPIRDSLADRACPACCEYIPFDALNDPLHHAPNYCKHCGQALDWEDDRWTE